MTDIEKAKTELKKGGFTFIAVKEDNIIPSSLRGVSPLLKMIDEGTSLEGFCVADRVVGRAAALLYVTLKAKEIFAEIISEKASEIFEEYGIPYSTEMTVKRIENRDRTGLCPMESAVMNIDNPSDAETALRSKLKELT